VLQRAELLDDQAPYHFHALRHFYGSMLIESGAPLPDVAKLMGHSAFDMTLQVYTHSVLQADQRHAFADQMAARLTIPGPQAVAAIH